MLKRFIHNSLQTLKKDNGAHFTYNMGVGFVRLGVFLFLLAAVIFGLSFIHFGTSLKYLGSTTVTMTDIYSKYYHSSRSRSTGYYKFVASFEFDFDNKSYNTTQYITEDNYSELTKSDADSFKMNIYSDQDNTVYLSLYDPNTAKKDYCKANPTGSFGVYAVYLCYIAFPIWLIGLGQERLAMKYPRNDVDVNGTSLTPAEQKEQDDLMREFDEAYEKFQQNKAAGLPTSVPPRTDGKYRLEQHRD